MMLFVLLLICAALGVGITVGLAIGNFASTAATDEVVFIQDAWIAAGGNPFIKPTKEELFDALRSLDEVCDEADLPPKVPDEVVVFMNHIEHLQDAGKIPEDIFDIDIWNGVTNAVMRERNANPL